MLRTTYSIWTNAAASVVVGGIGAGVDRTVGDNVGGVTGGVETAVADDFADGGFDNGADGGVGAGVGVVAGFSVGGVFDVVVAGEDDVEDIDYEVGESIVIEESLSEMEGNKALSS